MIGYWHSEDDPLYSDPGKFVDHNWTQEEKEEVINYLKSGEFVWGYRGMNWCRFRCGVVANGAREFSDGYYLWPEGLLHYIMN